MSDYRYVLQHEDGSCEVLEAGGIERKPKECVRELLADRYSPQPDRPMGEAVLRVFVRDAPPHRSGDKRGMFVPRGERPQDKPPSRPGQ